MQSTLGYLLWEKTFDPQTISGKDFGGPVGNAGFLGNYNTIKYSTLCTFKIVKNIQST